jgi:hypothetical protein
MGGDSSSSSDTTSKSFNFNNIDYGEDSGGDLGFAKNVNLAESTLSVGDVTSTDFGAVTSAIELAGRSNDTNAAAVLALGDKAYDDVEDSREMATSLFGRATDSVTSSNRDALQFLQQSNDRSLAFAEKATRSEGGQVVESLTRYFLIGGVSIAGLIFLTRGK